MNRFFNAFSRHSLLLCCAMLLLLGNSQLEAQIIRGSKNVVSQARETGYFNAVKVGGAIDLFITQGEAFQLEVRADDNIINHIETRIEDQVLVIGMRKGVNVRNPETMQVHLTAPLLMSIHSSGACDVTVKGVLRQEMLSVTASGASDLRMQVDVKHLELDASGASDVHLSGQAEYAKIKLGGASDMKNFSFTCDFLEVHLSGASDMSVTVNKQVSGKLSGACDLRLRGNALADVSTSGASSVIRSR